MSALLSPSSSASASRYTRALTFETWVAASEITAPPYEWALDLLQLARHVGGVARGSAEWVRGRDDGIAAVLQPGGHRAEPRGVGDVPWTKTIARLAPVGLAPARAGASPRGTASVRNKAASATATSFVARTERGFVIGTAGVLPAGDVGRRAAPGDGRG